MARAAVQRRLSWLLAEVVDSITETPRVRTIVLDCPGWAGHLPGQHLDIRLTAEDGYQAQRSYSIATPEAEERLAITVELVDDGEVSPFLVDELRVGDRVEIRGPIGGYFVWAPQPDGDPVLLVGGGSGVVPLMAMIRARARVDGGPPVRLLASSRSFQNIIYRDELAGLAATHPGIDVVHTLTRSQPPGWAGHRRRVDKAMLGEVAWPPDTAECFVSGPTGFVETVASTLVELGHEPRRVKTERFGPTGGRA